MTRIDSSRRNFGAVIGVAFMAVSSVSAVSYGQEGFDAAIVDAVQALYGIDEAQAVARLAAEAAAAEKYQAIRALSLNGYAGAWFDGATGTLQVGISDPTELDIIDRMGATPVQVAFSLRELEASMDSFINSAEADSRARGALLRAFVDYEANSVVVESEIGKASELRALIWREGLGTSAIEVRESVGGLDFTASVRGANSSWNVNQSTPCSVGASIVGGFITAGHCGETGHQMKKTATGVIYGNVIQSTYQGGNEYQDFLDSGWVSTTSSWTPAPQVNGYSNGTIYVDAKWSGTLEAPVGGTICTYGQTSGGPDCGTVTNKNFNVSLGLGALHGLSEGCNIDVQAGDSGGPSLTAAAQIQGTTIGNYNGGTTCLSNKIVFQPVLDTLDQFNRIMLTTHGTNKPTIQSYVCPTTMSGNGQYWCEFGSYKSQGSTTVSWSSNTGHSGSGSVFIGFCSAGQTVNVNLSISNPYGTEYRASSFGCPTYPP